jgi:hypothetical protein
MKRSLTLLFSLGLVASVIHAPVHADPTAHLRITAGSAYMSDEFTATGPLGNIYEPLIAKYQSGNFVYKLTLIHQVMPLLNDRAPADRTALASDVASRRLADSARGETYFAATYSVPRLGDTSWRVDVSAKETISSAYQKAELASPNHHAFYIDLHKTVGQLTLESRAGYKVRERLTGIKPHDSLYGSTGATYSIDSRTGVELFFDYRQSTAPGTLAEAEISTNVSRSISHGLKLQAYAMKGVSAGNRDWGTGLMLGVEF